MVVLKGEDQEERGSDQEVVDLEEVVHLVVVDLVVLNLEDADLEVDLEVVRLEVVDVGLEGKDRWRYVLACVT